MAERQSTRLNITLSRIENACQRHGLDYRLQHIAPNGTFARVRVSYFEPEDYLTRILADEHSDAAPINGLLAIQVRNGETVVGLQALTGRKTNVYQRVVLALLLDLLIEEGMVIQVEGKTWTPDSLSTKQPANTETPQPAATGAAEGEQDRSKRGPTVRTQERFAVFKCLKDDHPGWSQGKVAVEAGEKLGEVVTSETVRNAYRLMGEEWERADRIR